MAIQGTEQETSSKKDDDNKLNALQVTAATCASTTAAVVATALGVYGTVIGVAVFSIVSSVATVLFIRSMTHTKETIDKVVVKARDTKAVRSPAPVSADKTGKTRKTDTVGATGPVTGTASVTTRIVPAADNTDNTQVAPSPGAADTTGVVRAANATGNTYGGAFATAAVPTAGTPVKKDRKTSLKEFAKRNWRMLAVTCVAVFVLSIGVLTGMALLTGQPANAFYDSDPRPPGVTQDEDGEQPGTDNDETDSTSDEEEKESSTPQDEESTAPEESDTPQESPEDQNPTTQEPEDEGENTDEQGGRQASPSQGQ